ncbi:MAG: ABC transporter ATP-binding protein [Oscillospiraceae bacterium]|jgi:spermidine/putrescine transport system ATP-binding protein|nr:ABC transporter ATP-binding protein [Oscillospiraceae bacterium]
MSIGENNTLLELKNITLDYDQDRVLDNVSLYVKDKEFVTLLGPSGCGKTTTLRIIGGFVNPDQGDVYFEGKRINDLPPHKRKVNTVFQRYALFPHLNVFDNVAFGLKIAKVPEKEIKERVQKMLAMVDLKGFERRRVTKLSGGQQQRVAIARALVNHPKVLLLDEPLGALDLKLRKEMQVELKSIQQQLGITFIYVTHDQEEALSMSDTIVVMKGGEIQQIGSPEDIYNEPKNAFVADFIGESNIFDGLMLEDYRVRFSGLEFTCVDKGFASNQPVDVVVRPEDVDVVPPEQSPLQGVVTSVVFKGVHYEMNVKANGLDWMIHSTKCQNVSDRVGISFDPDDIHIMNKMFKGDVNRITGQVTGEDTVEFLDVSFTREGLGLPPGTQVRLEIQPEAIALVSEDQADAKMYLESIIWKGAYNEMIVYSYAGNAELMLHTQSDEQVATDVGIKFDFDQIRILPAEEVAG